MIGCYIKMSRSGENAETFQDDGDELAFQASLDALCPSVLQSEDEHRDMLLWMQREYSKLMRRELAVAEREAALQRVQKKNG